jgi:DNA repair exonuclease SbcCD nuclease subunit
VHAADLHLDSPFGGLAEAAPPNVAAAVQRATLEAWGRIVALAIAEHVDFVLIAGDVFDSEERTIRGQLAFVDGLRALGAARIPSFVVTGNHDPLAGWEPSIALPEGAYRFGAERVESRPVLRDGAEIARVYGISYPVRDVRDNLALQFRKEPGSPFAIGLLHANVGGQPGHANYAPCSVGDLAASGIDYWALGHVHRPQVLRDHAPAVVYAGNPQGRDVGEAEPRGAMLVTVDRAGRARVELRELDVIRWVVRAIDIAGLPDLDALLARLEQELTRARSAAARAVIARLELTGFGPLHAELRRSDTIRDLRDRLVERFATQDPFVWLADLRDLTRPEEARAIERAGDFLGELEAVASLALARAARGEGAAGDPGEEAVTVNPAQVADELFASPQFRVALRSAAAAGPSAARLEQLRHLDHPATVDLLRRAHRRIVDALAGRE